MDKKAKYVGLNILSYLINKIKELTMQGVYPVGSIYMSIDNSNPSDLFGFGTWERIQDRFLLGASNTYLVGSMGGEAEHVLTTDEMPNHSHIQLGVHGDEANSSPIRLTVQDDGNLVLYDSDGNAIWNSQTSGVNSAHAYRTTSMNQDGITGYTGKGVGHNNMPPYLSVYMWKRVE